ncbi:hypothetical protein GCM10008020_17320 [Massilia psychrophila]|nr:hypothetical protein GCM10008020_17320 [Massilia psychrophila]
MGAIDSASRKIVDIIAVIEGIAFQTNILALIAAVEAARAAALRWWRKKCAAWRSARTARRRKSTC